MILGSKPVPGFGVDLFDVLAERPLLLFSSSRSNLGHDAVGPMRSVDGDRQAGPLDQCRSDILSMGSAWG
jgi:hypothetical protein